MRSSPSRRRAGWVPNQHGAWAMLAAPLVVGMACSRPRLAHLPLTLFWFAGYLAFYAVSQWLKSRLRPRFRAAALTYSALASALGVLTLVCAPHLLRFAWWFALPAGVGLLAAWLRQERALWSGLATVVAATLMVPVAAAAGGGTGRVWVATGVLGAGLVGTLLFVRSMIRERANPGFHAASVGLHALATLVVGLASPWCAAMFVPLTARASALPGHRLTPMQVGMVELVAVLLTIAAAVVAA